MKRVWCEKLFSNAVSNVSLQCQAPAARVYSSLCLAPTASTHNSNGNRSFSSVPKPLAADDPQGESVQHASAHPTGAADAFFSSQGKAGKHASHNSSATGGRTCIRQGRSGDVLPEQAELPWPTGKGCCARLQCRVVVIHDLCPLRPPSS